MNRFYVLFFLYLFNQNHRLKAQNCGFKFEKNEEIEHFTEGYSQTYESGLRTRAVVRIPVVVHVVWRLSEENISDAQIQSQIDVLNKDFRKLNVEFKDLPANFKALADDCEIEFFLAPCDTNNLPTTGITRKQTSINAIGTAFQNNRGQIYYKDLGGVNNWNPSNYVNIWVCKMDNVLGFTSSLSKAMTVPSEDGIVVDYRFFGTIGTVANSVGHTKGRTLTHEMGHYFNLLHTWGSDATCNDDDLVNDTPLQADATIGCPAVFPFRDACSASIMYQNFMDYTNDECMGLFTKGQKTRILAALNGFRSGLLRGSNCSISSVENLLENEFFIVQNPSRNTVFIELKNGQNFSRKTIELCDNFGRILIQKNVSSSDNYVELDVSNLPSQVYFLRLKLDNQFFTKKILVLK